MTKINYRKTRKITWIFLLAILIQACSKDKIDHHGEDPAPGEVEYKQQALVADGDPGDVVVSVDQDKQVYTLRSSAFQREPKPGEAILVPGELLRKVKSVRSSGDHYILETEDAAVTDVIQNGSFSFNTQLDWGEANSIKIAGQEVLPEGLTLSSSIHANGKVAPISSTITYGGIDHTIIITPLVQNGRITSCNFQFLMQKGETAAFKAEGTATLPTQNTEIIIKDGKLTKFNSNNTGMKGNFKINMALAGGFSSSHDLPLPDIAFSFPIRFLPTPMGPVPNPIPMSVNVGINFVSQITASGGMSSARAESSVSYDGSAGFTYEGTQVKTTGLMNRDDIRDGIFDSASMGTTVDLQFGFAFPRVGLNIAGQEVAYVFFGFTTGSSIYFGPICKQGYAKLTLQGGYSLKVLGRTLVEGSETFYENYQHAGDDCSNR